MAKTRTGSDSGNAILETLGGHTATGALPAFPLPRTRATAVADELRRQIQSGELPPGTRLRQADIARRFGVSTTPVREALSGLAREGLVQRDAQRGAIVFVPSAEELQENYEIRIALEPLATRLATPNLTGSDHDALAGLVVEMREAPDGEGVWALNAEFHSRIYAVCERPRLIELIEGLRSAVFRYLRMVTSEADPVYWAESNLEHDAIIEALRRYDAAEAERLMAKHLVNSVSHLRANVFGRDAGPDPVPGI